MLLENTDLINALLNDLAEREIVEPTVEPIDENDCHPMDWAEVTGLVDEVLEEIYPQIMIDESGEVWYVA